MSTELLDKLESAIDHARPKDARRILTELRAQLERPSPRPAPPGQPAARGPKLSIKFTMGDGIELRFQLPPRPDSPFEVIVPRSQLSYQSQMPFVLEKAKKTYLELCKSYEEWGEIMRA